MTFYHLNNCFIQRLERLWNQNEHIKHLTSVCQILGNLSPNGTILELANGRKCVKDWSKSGWMNITPGLSEDQNCETVPWYLAPYIKQPHHYYEITKDYIKLVNHYNQLTLFVTVILQEFLKAESCAIEVFTQQPFVAHLCLEYIHTLEELEFRDKFELIIDYNNFELQIAWYKLDCWIERQQNLVVNHKNNILVVLSKLKNQSMTRKTVIGSEIDKILEIRSISNIVLNYCI